MADLAPRAAVSATVVAAWDRDARAGRGVPIAAYVVAATVAVLLIFAAAVALTATLNHTDFAEEFASATLLGQGRAAAVYDASAQNVVAASAGAAGTLSPASWSPVAQVGIIPLTWLPLRAATLLWILFQVGCLLAAAAVAVRATPWARGTPRRVKLICAGASLACVGTVVDIAYAQWDAIPTLGLALAYAEMRKGRDGRAMVWLVLTGLAGKPHLALGVGAFLLARRPRTLVTAAATAVLMTVGIALVVPVAALHGFLANAATQNGDQVLVAGSVGIPGLFSSLVGGAAGGILGYAGSALLLAGCFVLGRQSRGGTALEPVFLSVCVLSLLVPTHVFYYDFVQLVPGVIVLLAWCGHHDGARERTWPGPASLAVLGMWLAVTLIGYSAVLPLGSYSPSRAFTLLLVVGAAACGAAAARTRAPFVR